MYSFGRSIVTTSPSGRAVQETAVERTALRFVPDDVEGLARRPERALEQVVVVRRQHEQLSRGRARRSNAGRRAKKRWTEVGG